MSAWPATADLPQGRPDALYRALLHLYPAGFRAEYAADLCALFALRREQASNPFAVLLLWLDAIADTCSSAIAAHWDILRRDLAWSARSLRRSPAFTLTAIAVSALGIGATTAAFTLADHVLLRPLPYADSTRLVKIWEDDSTRGYPRMDPAPANYRDWKRLSHSFEGVEAWWDLATNLSQVGNPARLEGAGITAGLLPMLGVQPALGRAFSPEDDRPGAPGTVLLSDALWRARFAADPNITGRSVLLDSRPFTVIGVMPPGFSFPSRDTQIWIAARWGEEDFADRSNNYIRVLAKLRRGVSLESAQSEMSAVAAAMERAWPKEYEHIGARVNTLRDELSWRSRMLLTALLAAALCVLLIGCTNLANLLLARALARRKELAVRTAMGAGRERLVRQLLTESLLLAVGGGIAGVLLAFAALPLLVRLVPNSLPIAGAPVIDARVLLCAACITGLTALGFGILPALRACSGTLTGLREGSRSGAGGHKERLRSALVVAEIAGSLVLLICSGLLVRALWHLQNVDPGFRTAGVLTLRTALPMPKYEKVAVRDRFYRHVLQEARSLPGVSAAAYVSAIPLAMPGGIWPVKIPGRDPAATPERAMLRYVTPGYFDALGIPLHAGRDVSDADTRQAPFAAIVSESFARRYWPDANPLGGTSNLPYPAAPSSAWSATSAPADPKRRASPRFTFRISRSAMAISSGTCPRTWFFVHPPRPERSFPRCAALSLRPMPSCPSPTCACSATSSKPKPNLALYRRARSAPSPPSPSCSPPSGFTDCSRSPYPAAARKSACAWRSVHSAAISSV